MPICVPLTACHAAPIIIGMAGMHSCTIIENSPFCADVRRLVFESPDLAAALRPGQFMMLRCGGGTLLRRPFCASDADSAEGTATILYKVRGKGTMQLSHMPEGGELDVMGPLGNGFRIDGFADGSMKRAAIIGGGIGAFPLLFLARELRQACGAVADVWLGFRDVRSARVADSFIGHADRLRVTSDDGSIGAIGTVTDAFAADLAEADPPAVGPLGRYDAVFACGPEPMLKSVQGICAERELDAQLCVEQRMACGIGACFVCSCADARGGYRRVCKDGPVFSSKDIIFP